MNRMEKAKAVLHTMTGIHKLRVSRLEDHVQPGACSKCRHFQTAGEPRVSYCPEAKRLEFRKRSVETRARVLTLLILENIEAYR